MRYDEFRQTAQNGDIMFLTVNKKNILSCITSWFTGSKFTHAAFVFWYKDRLMLVESTTHGGIRLVNASIYHDRNMEYVPAPKNWELVENKAFEKLGTTDYGWFSAIWIGIRDFMFTQFNWKLPQNKNNRNKACSEFVAEILDLDDVDVPPSKLFQTLNK